MRRSARSKGENYKELFHRGGAERLRTAKAGRVISRGKISGGILGLVAVGVEYAQTNRQ